jgi:N6-L-threonylcarbamoyladenine synthase
MIILAIETSCDDTAIAVVEIKNKRFKILSNIISSQTKIHEKWGGVFPTLAKREHEKNLPLVFKKTIRKIKNSKIDAIAITVGPGLDPCLWSGIEFAKSIANQYNIPIIPVNHIEAHILVSLPKKFPAIALVVSGGHTQLILVKKIGRYEILGETRDDAAGECFDKTARILGIGYPGGPAIAAKAAQARGPSSAILLPRPMINSKDYDFSFSGLKTAVLYDFKNRDKKTQKSEEYIQEMCKEIQQSVIDVLVKKIIRAGEEYQVKTIILGGGVSANEELRKQLKEKIKKFLPNVDYLIPDRKYSTDNAVMAAIAGYYNLKNKTKDYNKIEAEANLRIG